jgi:cytochrome c oxidase subunit 2
MRNRSRLLLLLPAAALLAGCGDTQNTMQPQSHAAKDIASLWWWMMGIAWGGLILVVLLLVLAWVRRNRRGIGDDTTGPKAGEKPGWYVVVGGGIVLPIALIAALFVISDIFVIKTTQAPAADATKLTVLVIGRQWWWEIRYPGTRAVTANELHIPVRTPVRVDVQTADVIHSFSVPELNRTIDLIPGRTNAVELYANKVGTFRGQCREFCGLQHAHMALEVVAQPAAAFRRWLADQEQPAKAPSSSMAQKGLGVFLAGPCASCHTIRGTSASGFVGPDLTHLADRNTLGAVTIPNRKGYLAGWIMDSQDIKPGNQMPDMNLSGRELQELLAYLEGLH